MSQKTAKHIPSGSSEWQEKFINCMMLRGKKSVSRREQMKKAKHKEYIKSQQEKNS